MQSHYETDLKLTWEQTNPPRLPPHDCFPASFSSLETSASVFASLFIINRRSTNPQDFQSAERVMVDEAFGRLEPLFLHSGPELTVNCSGSRNLSPCHRFMQHVHTRSNRWSQKPSTGTTEMNGWRIRRWNLWNYDWNNFTVFINISTKIWTLLKGNSTSFTPQHVSRFYRMWSQ